MDKPASSYSLVDLLVVACANAWRDDGEILASGIGVVPRLGASLAMKTFNPDLMMTDGEAYLVSEPVPLGPRGAYRPRVEGWMSYSRVFDTLWGGFRHAMISPTQIDRYGQTNISCIGDDYTRPKVQLLGARGLPGNTANHANSMFVPEHTTRAFVSTEVDMVAGVGYNPKRRLKNVKFDYVDLRLIVSNLCVLDFSGPNHQISLRSIHAHSDLATIESATGFDLHIPKQVPHTSAPTQQQMDIISALDPHKLRYRAIKDNPVFNS
jgi:glutaconate CoA-transferase subunit B